MHTANACHTFGCLLFWSKLRVIFFLQTILSGFIFILRILGWYSMGHVRIEEASRRTWNGSGITGSGSWTVSLECMYCVNNFISTTHHVGWAAGMWPLYEGHILQHTSGEWWLACWPSIFIACGFNANSLGCYLVIYYAWVMYMYNRYVGYYYYYY